MGPMGPAVLWLTGHGRGETLLIKVDGQRSVAFAAGTR
jgi:hypothetical protein